MALPVTVVVPFDGEPYKLLPLLVAVSSGEAIPSEIVVVDTDKQREIANWSEVLGHEPNSDLFTNVRLMSIGSGYSFPGAARNVGILGARYDWIAFLDVCTIPSRDWLKDTWEGSKLKDSLIMIGQTRYKPCSYFQFLVAVSTFGLAPVKTVPGSLVHRSVIRDVGLFIPSIRAGEDTEWMQRLHSFRGEVAAAPGEVYYSSLPKTLIHLVFKWYRNYRMSSRTVLYLEIQRLQYLIALCTVIVCGSLFWNDYIASWDTSNPFYVSNITKMTAVALALSYAVLRGLVMPMKRTTSLKDLVPVNWIVVALMCLVIDCTKICAWLEVPN